MAKSEPRIVDFTRAFMPIVMLYNPSLVGAALAVIAVSLYILETLFAERGSAAMSLQFLRHPPWWLAVGLFAVGAVLFFFVASRLVRCKVPLWGLLALVPLAWLVNCLTLLLVYRKYEFAEIMGTHEIGHWHDLVFAIFPADPLSPSQTILLTGLWGALGVLAGVVAAYLKPRQAMRSTRRAMVGQRD